MEIEKAKSLDIARLLAFRGLMNGNNGLDYSTKKAGLSSHGLLFYPKQLAAICLPLYHRGRISL